MAARSCPPCEGSGRSGKLAAMGRSYGRRKSQDFTFFSAPPLCTAT